MMKAFTHISAIVYALFTLFSCLTIQAADSTSGDVSEVVQIVKKIRIPVNSTDQTTSEESANGDNNYGEMFMLDSASMRYELIDETSITDGGNTLTPDRLKTPCTVKLVAQRLGSGYCNALKIDVQSCASDASDAWFESSGD